uniref:Uncharacterized protein n=1 Tax=viral metagenome TaxID=1070528 RepID=A0A6C0EHN0_9ZZZZ
MTWIKIKYLQFNNLKDLNQHVVPYCYKNCQYYKIETEIINNYIIYIYVNIFFINNSIPQKKKLIELLNYTRQDFKFNNHYFNKYYKYINNQYDIVKKLDKNMLIKCVNNNSIVLNNQIINLSQKKILIKEDYKYISLNTYFLFNVKNESKFIDMFNKYTKKILIISKCNDRSNNRSNDRSNNRRNDRSNNNNYDTILIDNDFKNTIIKKTNYDLIIIIDCLEIILNNDYFVYINNLGCKNIFIEQNNNLDYNNYTKIKDMVFDKNYNNDLYLNINFITNNFILYYNKISNINTSIIRINSIKDLPQNINIYGTLFMFESILEKYNINYDLCVDDTNETLYCSISNIKNSVSIILDCNHCVSFNSLLHHLNYNNLCPICNASLFNTTIKLKASNETLINTLLSFEIIKNIFDNNELDTNTNTNTNNKTNNKSNVVILNNKLNYKTDLNLIYLNNRVKKINSIVGNNYQVKFVSTDNFSNYITAFCNIIKDINIFIIYETCLNPTIKYEILNSIDDLNITNLSKLNLIKCN